MLNNMYIALLATSGVLIGVASKGDVTSALIGGCAGYLSYMAGLHYVYSRFKKTS